MAFDLDSLLTDEAIDSVREEMNGRNHPEDLLERVLIECDKYENSGTDKYRGMYRGHWFFIGFETVPSDHSESHSLRDVFIQQMMGSGKKRLFFQISNKIGGYPGASDGLRYTEETKSLKHTLNVMYETAKELFVASEISRLMNAERNPVTDTDMCSNNGLIV